MQLSPEREAELVEQNMQKIYRAVDNFMAKCGSNPVIVIPYDDCVQEVSIAFLKYIRRCETEEQLRIFPWYDAIHVLTAYVLSSQPVKVSTRTSNFRNIVRSIPFTVSYDVMVSKGIEVDGMSKHWVPDKETELDFNSFMSDQDESVQRIAAMRLYGMSIRQIASQFGLKKSSVGQKIKKLREKYDEFDKGDEEE